ncbi:MAG: ClbS/DfsB family four-helix bundle protein [Candidatus Heimdallarchaeota archaeon]|nr:ClbS/DfsB family four-helix bundle protein [Candidatus Heimdallarchaeota archaeon]MCK4955650.1 ClbS/DfsB family four-helix bundle protein [Candidatus Heimdallarchaeota archaeon]
MEELRQKAQSWIEKLQTTTKLIKELPEDLELPNGWSIREITIHLQGWDEEFIKFSEKIKKGEPYFAFFSGQHDRYNQKFFEKNHNISLEQAKKQFAITREEITSVYENIANNYLQDDNKMLGFFSLWWHDVHHLKQTGIDVEFLME